jgi:hypothetical protein
MDFSIETTWNGKQIQHDPVKVQLRICDNKNALEVCIEAPFFNSPACPSKNIPGEDFDLWNYEG